MPFGLQGTVVSLFKDKAEVLFDHNILVDSGDAKCNTRSIPTWTLLNLSKKKLEVSQGEAARALGKYVTQDTRIENL